MKVRLRVGDREHVITADASGEIRVDERVSRLRFGSSRNGMVTLLDGERRLHAYVAADADTVWVFLDGRTWRFERTGDALERTASAPREPGATRRVKTKRAQPDHGLTSPMPATVVKVLVSPGDTVTKGDLVLVLEAMKMELPIRAPADGRVVSVSCVPGELVQPGVPLMEIE